MQKHVVASIRKQKEDETIITYNFVPIRDMSKTVVELKNISLLHVVAFELMVNIEGHR